MIGPDADEATVQDVVDAIDRLGERLDERLTGILDEMTVLKIEVMTVREAIEKGQL